MLGSDRDLPALAALLGPGTITAIVIGNAIHLMDHSRLFEAAQALLRPGGGVAVLANGTPVWQQDSAASHALRQVLEGWFETELTSACGTDQASRDQYAGALRAGGYIDVEETVLQDYRDELTPEYLIGHLYSAIPSRQLPTAEQRPEFERRIRGALGPASSFTERVRVVALTARLAA